LNKNTKLFLLALLGLGVIGCAGPAIAKASSADETGAGQKLYVAKCAKCHKFYDPAKYSEADWQMWMTKMGKKAKLKPEQQEELSRYIAENLRTPDRTNSAGTKALKR
jgi:mono/diheme cytochrome c family protein